MEGPKKRASRKGVKTPHPGLTPKSAAFVENIAKDLPLKAAVIFAGYPEKNAAALGAQLMKKPHIKEAISKRKAQAAEFAKVTPEEVLGATVQRAFCSIDDAFDENGMFSIELARETGAVNLIKKYKVRNGQVEVEFYDNAQAQEKLANYLGMDVAPKANNDINSLKEGIEQIAQTIAQTEGRVEVTKEDRKAAFIEIQQWISESRSMYSKEAIQEVSRDIIN